MVTSGVRKWEVLDQLSGYELSLNAKRNLIGKGIELSMTNQERLVLTYVECTTMQQNGKGCFDDLGLKIQKEK